jgi:hypothetical protein
MVSTPYTLRLDPFAADFDAAIQWNEADEPSASVDVTVERADWGPTASPNPARVLFVDGLRRVKHRPLVEGDAGSLYGLLGSFGVGAACLNRNPARITHEHIGRLCVVGGGVLLPGVNAPVTRRPLHPGLRAVARSGEHADGSAGRAADGHARRGSAAGRSRRRRGRDGDAFARFYEARNGAMPAEDLRKLFEEVYEEAHG